MFFYMMLPLNIYETTLPLTSPVLKFLVILIIILFAPLLLNKIKIPPLLGLIIAGAVIGPFGSNLIERDGSIILSGTAGLFYIMFLAGLEIDMADFKKNSNKSLVFGLFTFIIPMTIGIFSTLYLLNMSLVSSVLLASMYASHTLIAYPIIRKYDIVKNRAVTIAVGGTVITDILALLVLAIIVGMTKGEMDLHFWLRLTISTILFGCIILFLFPVFARWFFKRFQDNVTQYIFVLVLVYLGAVLAELASIEGIVGAFLTGLALNKMIPHTSPLMNRIEFVGNAIFIPFFLIGVGMLIDYRIFFKDTETIKVAAVMTIVATLSKFLAAWFTQKTYRLSKDERRIIFGLSNAQAAATLAAVLIGYNLIIGETETGEPIRLLNESILNGTILMILITCTIASVVAQKGAKKIAMLELNGEEKGDFNLIDRTLIPLNQAVVIDDLVNLGVMMKSKKNKESFYGLNVISQNSNHQIAEENARKVLSKAAISAAATDTHFRELIRYDLNIVNGISGVINEHKITDLILAAHSLNNGLNTFHGKLIDGILKKCPVTAFIFKPSQPLATIKRHIIVIPPNAQEEVGFPFWLVKVWNLARNSGAKLVFYGTDDTLNFIKEVNEQHPINAEFVQFNDYEDFLIVSTNFQDDDNLIVVLSRKENVSYHKMMDKIPGYLNKYFKDRSVLVIYPKQENMNDPEGLNLTDPTFMEPFEKLDDIRKTFVKMLLKK